jgi:hypothetical protein
VNTFLALPTILSSETFSLMDRVDRYRDLLLPDGQVNGNLEEPYPLIRYYFPIDERFLNFTPSRLNEVEHCLNSRPRKILGFIAPVKPTPLK